MRGRRLWRMPLVQGGALAEFSLDDLACCVSRQAVADFVLTRYGEAREPGAHVPRQLVLVERGAAGCRDDVRDQPGAVGRVGNRDDGDVAAVGRDSSTSSTCDG